VTRYTYSAIQALARLKSVRPISSDARAAANNKQRGTTG
jgi:hypothetical protein